MRWTNTKREMSSTNVCRGTTLESSFPVNVGYLDLQTQATYVRSPSRRDDYVVIMVNLYHLAGDVRRGADYLEEGGDLSLMGWY